MSTAQRYARAGVVLLYKYKEVALCACNTGPKSWLLRRARMSGFGGLEFGDEVRDQLEIEFAICVLICWVLLSIRALNIQWLGGALLLWFRKML